MPKSSRPSGTPSYARSEAYRRVLDAIALARRNRDMSLSNAAKMSGTTLSSIRKYASEALEPGSCKVKPTDRLPRLPMWMLTPHGMVSVIPANSVVAKRLARHANAVREYVNYGNARALTPFRGRSVRSEGEVYEFVTDLRTINRLARAGAIYFLDIYDSGDE